MHVRERLLMFFNDTIYYKTAEEVKNHNKAICTHTNTENTFSIPTQSDPLIVHLPSCSPQTILKALFLRKGLIFSKAGNTIHDMMADYNPNFPMKTIFEIVKSLCWSLKNRPSHHGQSACYLLVCRI